MPACAHPGIKVSCEDGCSLHSTAHNIPITPQVQSYVFNLAPFKPCCIQNIVPVSTVNSIYITHDIHRI